MHLLSTNTAHERQIKHRTRINFRTSPFFSLIVCFVLLCFPLQTLQEQTLGSRSLQRLTSSQIATLATTPDPAKNLKTDDSTSHLSKILIPRAPDTENNTLVRKYIISTLKALNWHIEEDNFLDNTPYGVKNFTNVIATKDPSAPRRLIVAAHFDSKFFPSSPMNQFVGATDSAVPCAIMLDLAEALNALLDERKKRLEAGEEEDEDVSETTLQLVFFDGEEAFKDWTSTDSVYGARHLAEKWATTYIAPQSGRSLRASATEISTIEHLVLLDLLGAPNPLIQSYFVDTAWLFDGLIQAESRLADIGAVGGGATSKAQKWKSFFIPRTGRERNFGGIEDDHIPFLRKGVSILHLITSPFPRVWHTLQDDASALDLDTMQRWNMIMRVFLCEYLHLRPESKPSASMHERNRDELNVNGTIWSPLDL